MGPYRASCWRRRLISWGKKLQALPGTKFWHSTLRSDLNLSFWTAEAEGWIRRISLTFEPQDETPRMRRYYSEQLARKLYVLLADLAWLFKDYSEESIRQKLAENPDSPDLKWWTVTITGQRALVEKAQEIEAAKQEQEKQSRGIGFHRGP